MSGTNKTLALGINNYPEKTATVEEFIEAGSADDITYYNFSILEKYKNDENITVEYVMSNIIYDYMDEIMEKAVEIELSDDDYMKYRYKPKLLAYDVYKTTEVYFVILAMNGMCSIKDFTKRKLKMLYTSDLIDLLNQIYSAEQSRISHNRKHLEDSSYTW